MADEDIRETYEKLKRLDQEMAPGFQLPSNPVGPRWRLGSSAFIGLAGAAAAIAVALFSLIDRTPETSTSPGRPPELATAVRFDQYSDVVSRELFAASAANWESPTDFLLDVESGPTD